jgi:histo-blood group ABO system transferase
MSVRIIRLRILCLVASLNWIGAVSASSHAKLNQNSIYKIGLCIVATGKYIDFAHNLIRSARHYFCPNHNVTYFLFTDQLVEPTPDIIVLPHRRLGWPYDTMMRFHIYDAFQKELRAMDYVFATDADMLFVDSVGDEILAERVGTQHPGFVGQRGTYEANNALSCAYVRPQEGTVYFAGGFYGGTSQEFLTMVAALKQAVNRDLLNLDYIAVWHDESHLNRYFIDNPPTVTLSPSYCYPESLCLPYTKKLLALDKNHQEYQTGLSL